jgi:hypothetical protein
MEGAMSSWTNQPQEPDFPYSGIAFGPLGFLLLGLRTDGPSSAFRRLSMAKSGSHSSGKTFMTPAASARITSAQAKASGGQVSSSSFAARAASAAVRNVNNSSGGTKK